MQKSILKRGLVIEIILLLVGVSVISIISGGINIYKNSNQALYTKNTFIDWENLTNPILYFQNRSLKDITVIYFQDYFYVFASVRVEPDAPKYNGTIFKTKDFKIYEEFHSENTGGSSTIIKIENTFYMVFQKDIPSWHPKMRRLYYSTSTDLINWSAPTVMMPYVQPYMRHIDGALAYEDGYFYLCYKGWQKLYVTRSKNKEIDGNWLKPFRAWPGGPFRWAENCQFIKIDGSWYMVATSRPPYDALFEHLAGFIRQILHPYVGSHAPYIYSMDGTGADFKDWTRWINKTFIDIPGEEWNQLMIANSGYLCDWREHDGYYYLFYAGGNDWWQFEERGHLKIGVARSKDLMTWSLPSQIDY